MAAAVPASTFKKPAASLPPRHAETHPWCAPLCTRMSGNRTFRVSYLRAHDQMRQMVGFSAADEIEKLDKLKASKSIGGGYARLRARLVQ